MSRIEDLLKEIDEMQFPFHVDRGVYETILTREQTDTIRQNVKEALALLAEQPKAGEFAASYRRIINTADPMANSKIDRQNAPIKILADYGRKACDMLDRLERENKEKMDIIAKGFNEAAETLLEPLKIQLATKDEDIAGLQEQLIKMCRVFHSIDCVCKWCNIAKERAVAGT